MKVTETTITTDDIVQTRSAFDEFRDSLGSLGVRVAANDDLAIALRAIDDAGDVINNTLARIYNSVERRERKNCCPIPGHQHKRGA